MKQQHLTLNELASIVLNRLEELDYSPNTITNYRRFYRRFLEYAHARGETYFSEALGRSYLHDFYGCDVDTIHEKAPSKKQSTQIRYIRVLGDYQIHGTILRRKMGPLAAAECPPQFSEGFDSYKRECIKRNYSEQGNYTRQNRIKHFLFFLNDRNISTYEGITALVLSDYVKTLMPLVSKSVQANLVAVRCFLRHLYLKAFTLEDMSEILPKQKNYYAPKVPRIWKRDEVKTVLESIDRGNPTGKRDYAILLMIARLGLRASDIKALKLENIHWDTNTLEIIQHKTKVAVSYPLLLDIGWAVIDYLKNGRPVTDSPYVFVRHNAPFEAFAPNAAMNRILVGSIRKAGIKIPHDVPSGLHSLRHSLASTLLEEDIPLATISEILGHMSIKSTDVYIHIDMKRLKECTIDPEEVFVHGK